MLKRRCASPCLTLTALASTKEATRYSARRKCSHLSIPPYVYVRQTLFLTVMSHDLSGVWNHGHILAGQILPKLWRRAFLYILCVTRQPTRYFSNFKNTRPVPLDFRTYISVWEHTGNTYIVLITWYIPLHGQGYQKNICNIKRYSNVWGFILMEISYQYQSPLKIWLLGRIPLLCLKVFHLFYINGRWKVSRTPTAFACLHQFTYLLLQRFPAKRNCSCSDWLETHFQGTLYSF